MEKVAEAFVAAVELAGSRGSKKINELPGCDEHQVDERWWIAINGHGHEVKCSGGGKVPPMSVYIKYNDWPVGVINPHGGIIAVGGEVNEDGFIAAVRAATK